MISDLSLPLLLLLLSFSGGVILLAGTRMTALADRIADRTGLGEALIGGLLLGAATSLSGTVVSVTAALDGRASLAFSNAVGGIAAQTAFLAIADLLYLRANLEHAAAELANVFQAGLLMLMLTLPFLAWTSPEATLFAIHPVSVLLFAIYVVGMYSSHRVREEPMWEPVDTAETDLDQPDPEDPDPRSTLKLFGVFALLLVLMGVSGWVIAETAGTLADRYDLRTALVGALMTAVITSMPELVTTLAAVRQGSLQLAVGGIIGGNTFDVLFLTISDIAYRPGSLFHAAGSEDYFWLAVGLAMTAVLMLGLIFRQRQGPGQIGFESLTILLIYGASVAIQALA